MPSTTTHVFCYAYLLLVQLILPVHYYPMLNMLLLAEGNLGFHGAVFGHGLQSTPCQ